MLRRRGPLAGQHQAVAPSKTETSLTCPTIRVAAALIAGCDGDLVERLQCFKLTPRRQFRECTAGHRRRQRAR
jgi:hypothetical protein